MTNRRFPPPWTVIRLPGGLKVIDANGQSLAYFYDANRWSAHHGRGETVGSNFAKLPELLGRE